MTHIKTTVRVHGEYRLQVKNAAGVIDRDTGWFDNTITNQCLNAWAGSTPLNTLTQYCGVGVGTAAPTTTNSSITGQIGSRASSGAQGTNVVGLVHTTTKQYNFAVSAVIGTITEVGIFSAPTGGVLATRALIKDGGGVPTSITLVSGDTLYVIWRCTVTAPSSDYTGVVSISGVNYNVVARPSYFVTGSMSSGLWSGPLGAAAGDAFFGLNGASVYATQTLGAVTAGPLGSSNGQTSSVVAAYVDSTYTRTCTATWSVANGNAAGGVGSAAWLGGSNSGIQVSYAAVSDGSRIPKDATKTMTLTLSITVSR